MPPILFDPATMSTGVSSVDQQHRQLIDQINALVVALERGDEASAVGTALRSMQEYTRTHFTHEEKCMRDVACPALKLNELAHATFLRNVEDLSGEFARTGPTRMLATKVQSSMGMWLKTHIVNTDTKLRPCVPAGAR